jgi:DNA mismatch repair ATPase MutS
MRQVALIALLAQAGSYVPRGARASASWIGCCLACGASDNVARGESTFMVEMRETAAILRAATPQERW